VIIATPQTVPGEHGEAYHGGHGAYFRRTLLDGVPGSVFKYVRDITFPPGTVVGDHTHWGEEEIFFIISGSGVVRVDGEECTVGPGSAVLTLSGSVHGLRNEGPGDLRIFVACAASASQRNEA
jgi:quercetin dioxygenase-like cupin family protein